jgi:hypothetical protein
VTAFQFVAAICFLCLEPSRAQLYHHCFSSLELWSNVFSLFGTRVLGLSQAGPAGPALPIRFCVFACG